MADDRPDAMQTLWLVRGTFFLVVGTIVLIVAVFDSSDRPFELLAAFAALAFGTWDISLALSSMEDDEAKRLSSPARVESAEQGLDTAGWSNSPSKNAAHSDPGD